MTTTGIKTAMVLAAGLGTRMRPITDTLPKPLVQVGGRTLLDRALDTLAAAGVERAVINIHHLGERITRHLQCRRTPVIAVSDETDALLDSGGGTVKALPLLGEEPFFILNADTFWLESEDARGSNLRRMTACFLEADVDMVMLVVRPPDAVGHQQGADFSLTADRRLTRHVGTGTDPVIYAGALLVRPSIFADAPAGAFSLNRCFDAALATDRLRAVVLRGRWITVGTPQAIPDAEAAIAAFGSNAQTASPVT